MKPDATEVEIPFECAVGPHALMAWNFVNAILDGEPLTAPGADGIHPLELANALVYSSLRGEKVELPMDGTAREMKLHQLIAESRAEKQIMSAQTDDFAGSFRK